MDPFVFIALILVAAMGVLFLIPTGRRRKKRSARKEAGQEEAKDWQAVSLKLERYINALRREIEQGKKRELVLDREITVQKEKLAKSQGKLSQERSWQSKEQSGLKKKTQEVIRLKGDLKNTEQRLTQEHSQRLRLEREVKSLEETTASVNDAKLALETDIARLNIQAAEYRKEIAELRKTNNQLSKKHDEATWVAKSEYLNLEQEMKVAREEIARLKEQFRREMM